MIPIEERIPFDRTGDGIPVDLSTLFAAIGAGGSGHDRVVYLDVETTGLSMGAGTLVILVGLGFVDGNEFVVQQHFLHDPSAERAMLGAIADRLARFDWLITFNGKSFDAPILTGRYRLHRLSDPLPGRHLDLLHPARRIWRRRLYRSNLSTLEARVLGIVRESDVPGSEIPGRYFGFLREGQNDLIGPILDHNRQDVVTLARLAGLVERLLTSHEAARCGGPSDLLGLGNLLENAGQHDRARQYYEAALAGASPADRADALLRLANIARQAKDLDRAIQLFDVVASYSSKRAILAAIELAKIYEHRLRQPDRALGYAQRALDLLLARGNGWARASQPWGADSRSADVVRRIERLETLLAKRGWSARCALHPRFANKSQ